MTKLPLLPFLLASLFLPAGAQTPQPALSSPPPAARDASLLEDRAFLRSGWVAVQGPHLSEQQYNRTLAMLETGSSVLQDQALADLEELLRQGSTDGNDPNTIQLVSRICLEPLTVIHHNRPELKFQDPAIRARALTVMGLAGGSAMSQSLLLALEIETEPMVLAVAYQTWRTHLPDNPERLIPVMTRHLGDPFPNRPNTALMLEVLATIRESHRVHRSMLDAGLMKAIMKLSNDSAYGRNCNSQAASLLKFLLRLPE